jgi:hypothetical protein
MPPSCHIRNHHNQKHTQISFPLSRFTLTYMKTDSSKLIPCDFNSHPVSQEIPCLLWNPKVHYHVHKSPPLVPTLSQMNPLHNPPPRRPKIHSNIILPLTPRSSEWPPRVRFSNQYFLCISYLPACYILQHPQSMFFP